MAICAFPDVPSIGAGGLWGVGCGLGVWVGVLVVVGRGSAGSAQGRASGASDGYERQLLEG